MSVVSHIDPRKARFDPSSAFASPFELADAVGLTRGQKLSALKSWAFDVERRLAAASEGMQTRGLARGDLKLLEDIRLAQARLSNPADGLEP